MKKIFTIGHSISSPENFHTYLLKNKIDVVVDVRSVPYSRFADWFNKDELKEFLKSKNIYYIFMGDALGARWEDEKLLFEDGKVDFEKVKETKKFQDGINRVINGIKKGYNIALMCSEKEPFDCHRFVLISSFLKENFKDLDILHIYEDKTVSHKELEKRLIKKYEKKLPLLELGTKENIIKEAYKLRNKDIAYNALEKIGDEI